MFILYVIFTKEAYQNAKPELNKLIEKGEKLRTVIVHCKKYFELKTKTELTADEQLKFKIFTQTAERIQNSDESDIERVCTLKVNVDKKRRLLLTDFTTWKNGILLMSKPIMSFHSGTIFQSLWSRNGNGEKIKTIKKYYNLL